MVYRSDDAYRVGESDTQPMRLLALILLLMGVSVAGATETPTPETTVTRTPWAEIVCIDIESDPLPTPMYEYTLDEGRAIDTSWARECAPELLITPKDKCQWVTLIGGATATPRYSEPTPTITPTPDAPGYTECGQSLPIHDWTSWSSCTPTRNPDGSWSSCVHALSAQRFAQLNIEYIFPEMMDISNLTFSYTGSIASVISGPAQGPSAVTIQYCSVQQTICHSSNVRTATYNYLDYPDFDSMGISQDRAIRIRIALRSENCSTFVCSDESMQRIISLNSVRFCASGMEFPPEATPTPSPTPTMTPTPTPEQPPCSDESERLMRVTAVEDCNPDDDRLLGWFKGNGDDLVMTLTETPEDLLPGNPPSPIECYEYSLNHTVNLVRRGNIRFAAEMDDHFYISRVRADIDVWGDGMSQDDFTTVLVQIYNDREVVYEDVVDNIDWFYLDTIDIEIPRIYGNGVGFSVPGYNAINNVNVFMLEVHGAENQPCTNPICDVPRYADEIPPVFDFDKGFEKVGRRCYTLIPQIGGGLLDTIGSFLGFDFPKFVGLQLCLDLYNFPSLTIFDVKVDTLLFVRVGLIAFIIRNVMTR